MMQIGENCSTLATVQSHARLPSCAAPLLACHPLPTSSEWPNAFNNTAIQFVRRAALTELSSDRGFFEPPRTKDPSA